MLANKFDGEIISADSRQVYRGMDIGTGKDLSDYVVDGKNIPHHLIDVIDPAEEFNLFMFQQKFYKSFGDISQRGKIPFLVGGTGLYLHSVLKTYNLKAADFDERRFEQLNKLGDDELKEILVNLNPNLHNTTDLLLKERIIRAIMISEINGAMQPLDRVTINSLTIGVNMERDEVKKRITTRLKQRLQSGMIDEVKYLMDSGVTYERLQLFGLEYKFISLYLKGELNYNDMYQKLNSAIHSFAKRQMTWFRKMEKEGVQINWINGGDYNAAERIMSENYF